MSIVANKASNILFYIILILKIKVIISVFALTINPL